MIRAIIISVLVGSLAFSAAAQEASQESTQEGAGKTQDRAIQDRVQPDEPDKKADEKGSAKKVLVIVPASGPTRSACLKPCRSWSSWQPDPAFSFQACMAKCVPDPAVSDSVVQRSQHLQEELQRRANEMRKQREGR